MENMEFTLKFKLLVLGIVVCIATFLFATIINQYVLRSKAAAGALPIKLSETTGSIAGTKDVSVVMTSSDKISGFTLVFKTTGNVRVHDSKEPSVLGNVAGTPAGFFSQVIKTTEKVAYGIIKDDASLPLGVSVPIVLSCDGVGSGTFEIAVAGSQVVGPGGINYILDPIDKGTYTCTSASTNPVPTSGTPAGPRAYFSPDTAKIAVGAQSRTSLLIDGFATGQQISGFDVKMQVAEGIDIVAPTSTGTVPGGSCKLVVYDWSAQTRMLRVSQLCTGATLPSSATVPIAFTGSKNALGKITITELEVVGPQAPNGYTVAKEAFSFQVGDSATGTVTGTPGNMHLILTLRLQGIQAKPKQANALQFKVGVINNSMESPIMQNASFTADDKGLYHGNVGINAPTGAGYCILVKGPFHLQKKICDISPSETFPGTYSGEKGKITLNNGDNTFDFSKVYLMSCDLPAQDGICNSYDMTFLRENLGKTDASALSTGDINQDGILNGQDYALAIASLSIKVDDH